MGLQKDSETGINIRLNVTKAVCCRYLNDVEIVNNEHFKVGEKPDEYIFRVDIDDVNEDHCGKIKVVGKNENGQDVKEVSGIIFYHGAVAQSVKHPKRPSLVQLC